MPKIAFVAINLLQVLRLQPCTLQPQNKIAATTVILVAAVANSISDGETR